MQQNTYKQQPIVIKDNKGKTNKCDKININNYQYIQYLHIKFKELQCVRLAQPEQNELALNYINIRLI